MISACVYAVELDDELLVWDGRAQTLHRMNAFATRAWHAITTSESIEVASEVIAAQAGIDAVRARRDVETFVAELIEAGVLERREGL